MKFLKIISSSVFQILSIIFVFFYLFGLLDMYFSDKTNRCEMTYMFEYPQFVRISVPENNLHPQYGLYAYGEGRMTEKARKMWFDGIPVLFLPGNSGSHMQSRSIASVALRKAISSVHDYHFDYFTVSFNEDLSGLYGGVLHSETEFAAACITKILSLYKNNKYNKYVPSSVILIGHSMGGVIAKRLLAYPSTLDSTSIAITLAAPLEAPVINTDLAMNDFYRLMKYEWDINIHNDEAMKSRKVLLSFGNGPRDLLMPSYLTSSNDSDINALTTSIPGVWVSPDHVSIVWCKQLVKVINRFLFSIVDQKTEQIVTDKGIVLEKAKQYFQANRSTTMDPNINHSIVNMVADGFWYEDNRRIYTVSRPEIDKVTYLMIRLVTFPQNRFVAVEAINVDDQEWVYGCSADHTYGTHRYCKQATSLSELSRWSPAAIGSGIRKLATINLHDILEKNPSWSHVVIKVSPTRKPITLNVDINDYASRQLTVDLSPLSMFTKTVVIQETQPNSLYYEIVLPNLVAMHQTYYLYVEPSELCRTSQYHVTAELTVPWAENQGSYHYFTPSKKTPMKLRLFKTSPNATLGEANTEHVKIILLLDPQCTFTVSISPWNHRLAQLARYYSPVLAPYIAAIVLLAARTNILHLSKHGTCISTHQCLINEGIKILSALVFSRLTTVVLMTTPLLVVILENPSWDNTELTYFTRSILVLPAFITALGIVNILVLATLGVLVFSSQLAHRLLFRILWRGGPSIVEKVASGLQKIPLAVSAAIVFAVPMSCGAAALVAGGAFYAFMISKMFEEYLEDYVYKLMAKIASRLSRIFKSKKATESSNTALVVSSTEVNGTERDTTDDENKSLQMVESPDLMKNDLNDKVSTKEDEIKRSNTKEALDNNKQIEIKDNKNEQIELRNEDNKEIDEKCEDKKRRRQKTDEDADEELSNLHFHVTMFFLWMVVTLVNVPALLTWARNFKHSIVLKPDTSYLTGLIMSVCSATIWQIGGPRKNLRHYESLSALMLTMAVFILAIGPFSLYFVNYGITLIFVVITLQQLLDKPIETGMEDSSDQKEDIQNNCKDEKSNSEKDPDINTTNDCDECSESSMYEKIKNIKDKFDTQDDL